MFAAAAALLAGREALSAEKKSPHPVLAVVTTPTGSGTEAEIARLLVPGSKSGHYALVDIGALRSFKTFGGMTEIEKKVKDISEKATEAALAFDLVLAAQLWRRAADDLLRTELVPPDTALAASYLLEAGAASAEAGEKDLAMLYFRKALALDEGVRPGATISPGTKEIFESALALGPSHLRPASDKLLRKLCAELKVDGILWISTGRDDEGLVVTEKLFLAGGRPQGPETSHHPPAAEDELDTWIKKEKKRLEEAIALRVSREPDEKKPWYKRWWVYAAIGGVLAAGAVGVAAGIASRPEEVDVVVHH